MTEQNPDHESDQPLSPELAFNLVKTGQLFASTLLSQAKQGFDWQILLPRDIQPGEVLNSRNTREREHARFLEFDYREKDEYLGPLREWETKLFSFKDEITEEGASPKFSMSLPLEPVDHPVLEIFFSSGNHEIGARSGVDVRIPFEAPALIRETVIVDRSHEGHQIRGPEGEWRPMTQIEGQDMLMDLAYLQERLTTAIAEGQEIKY